MRNTKTKYALVSSIISIFLCAVMLIGTTFAWFTDEANTAVNTIQSGTLDVALVDDAGESLEGASLEWVKAEGEDAVLWEPGCTYETAAAYIKNEGNLALKYMVLVNGIDGDAELLDVIDFKVLVDGEEIDVAEFEGALLPDESAELVIVAHMDEEAGNEYQDKAIEGISITVKAAQDTVEYDSYDNQYDANATYADEAADEEEPTEPEAPVEPEYDDPVDVEGDMSGEIEITGNFSGDYIVKAKKTVSQIYLHDVVADVKNAVILEKENTVYFENCDITLPEGGKLVVDKTGTITQVVIVNVTVNGDKIDSSAEAKSYMSGVEYVVYGG